MRYARIALATLLVAASFFAGASCNKDPECTDVTPWAGFTQVTLKQTYGGVPGAANWRIAFDHATMDASVEVDMQHSGIVEKGTVGLVGGRIMLSKGLKLESGYEIDALDAPVLSTKLVMMLLARAYPKGPDLVAGTKRIDRTDKVGMKFATPSASGYIPPPWRLKGKVSKAADGRVTYDLALSYSEVDQQKKRRTFAMNMAGELAMLGRPVFLDTDSLEGWTTYGLGPQETKQGTSTILDYSARPDLQSPYKTVGDIRAFIAAENHPGTRDETKDFTGFWKTKCEEAFGLQIKPHGMDGKYSVVFCGPGGCGSPQGSRPTFITGDKRWEVVSEDELVEIYRSGERSTYRRCTRETNPALKY
jgi:hypothetical protein